MRKEKPLLKDEIQKKIDESKSMIVVRYDRLEPNASWNLRNTLETHKSDMEVVRKSVFLKAIEPSKLSIDAEMLGGNIALVLVEQEDAIAPAKAVFEFSANNGKILEVLCGIVEGKLVPGSELKLLAELPSLDELRAMLLGLFTAPMSQMLSVMEAKVDAEPSEEVEQKD